MLTVQSVPEPSINGVVITFNGEMTGTTADHLAAELQKIGATKPANAVLDFSRLSMMDSRAIGLLTAFRTTLKAANPTARVLVASAPAMIEKAMKLTRVSEIFPLHLSVPEAVRALAEGAQTPAGRR